MEKIFWVFIVFLVIGCGNKGDLMYTNTSNNLILLDDSVFEKKTFVKDKTIIDKILHSNEHKNIRTVLIKTKIYVLSQGTAGKSKLDFSLETRILKDSIYWGSITYYGIELVRIKVTKNDFLIKMIGEKESFYLHKFMEQMYDSAIAKLKQRAYEKNKSVEEEITNLQSMKNMMDYIKNNQQEIFLFMTLCFLGEPPLAQSHQDSLWFDQNRLQYFFSRSFGKGKLMAVFDKKDNNDYILNKLFIKQGKKMYLGVHFFEYEKYLQNDFLPKKFLVVNDLMDNHNQHQRIQLKFENKTIKINSVLNFPFPALIKE